MEFPLCVPLPSQGRHSNTFYTKETVTPQDTYFIKLTGTAATSWALVQIVHYHLYWNSIRRGSLYIYYGRVKWWGRPITLSIVTWACEYEKTVQSGLVSNNKCLKVESFRNRRYCIQSSNINNMLSQRQEHFSHFPFQQECWQATNYEHISNICQTINKIQEFCMIKL